MAYLNLLPPPSLLSSFLNLDVGKTPTGTSSSGTALATWGEWIVYTAGLDKTKWKVNANGIEPIYQFNATTPTSSQSCGLVITINPAQAQGNTPPNITFDPSVLTDTNSLCKGDLNLEMALFFKKSLFESKLSLLFHIFHYSK